MKKNCLVDVSMVLSDHFPLIFSLFDLDADSYLQGQKRPLMVNNILIDDYYFKLEVMQMINKNKLMFSHPLFVWMHICSDLQYIVRKFGKRNAAFRRGKCKTAQETIEHLTQQAKVIELCQRQLLELQQARDVLKQDDLDRASKCRFLCRVHALQDCNDVSKGFFNKLKAKRKRGLMHCLQMEDGTKLSRACDIMQSCENFNFDLLAGKMAQPVGRDVAIKDLLYTVDPCIEQTNARRLEAPFEEAEVHYALSKLGNEKTHGICGISKEFVMAFWNELKDIILFLLNSSWSTQYMDPCLKQGLIKLIPKQTFSKQLNHWRHISMMGIVYKLTVKAVALRLSPLLSKFIHKAQSRFISSKSFFHNILSVQLGIEHALRSSQDMVLLQVDYEKAFDTVQWDFIAMVLQKIGFGPRVVNCIFMLGKDAWSRLLVNVRMSNKVHVGQSMRRG
ncbi:hypothetical protein L7F22_010330 [Adiantum nelumboides]|nr:hypothetical protein [Adiantum nelumboides]